MSLYQRHQIVLEEFHIGIPEPQLTLVEVPGRNGKLDMSEALTGYTTYHNRSIELVLGIVGDDATLEQKRQTLGYRFFNREVRLHFSHLNGYFKGRCVITDVTREHGHYAVKVQCDCYPYRFLDKEFHQERTLSSTSQSMLCLCMMMPSVPKIETTGNATIQFKGSTYTVQKGVHTLPILFKTGNNELKVSGSGVIKVTFKQGVI
ncbi:hypothetical protein ACVRY7_05620 [Streptococcus ictaluri]|nr:hypothetical protein [Streptococcus ictaluri]